MIKNILFKFRFFSLKEYFCNEVVLLNFFIMISKYKNAQLIFIDGKTPSRIKRVIRKEGRFVYEMRETGEILDEERISLLRN